MSIYVVSSIIEGSIVKGWYEPYKVYKLSMNAFYALYFFVIACLALAKSPGYITKEGSESNYSRSSQSI